jgi:probable F420-dependent oxidoreductase
MNRLGVSFSWKDKSLDDIIACARFAEDVGLESVWISEAWGRDAFLALAAVGMVTKRVKLASGIVNVFSRSPAMLAMSAATLDELSKGRAVLGLGSSGAGVIERWHGLHYEQPFARLRETVTIVRQILSGNQVNLEGQIFRVKDFRLAVSTPAQRVPIYIGALGPRMLRLGGEIADGVILYLCPLPRIPDAIKEAQSRNDSKGRHAGSLDVAAFLLTHVSENREQARRSVARTIAYYVGGMGEYYYRIIAQSGFPMEADAIRAAWRRGDREKATIEVTEPLIDSVALAGNPADCRKKLNEFRTAGVKLPILSFYVPEQNSRENVHESIKALATE